MAGRASPASSGRTRGEDAGGGRFVPAVQSEGDRWATPQPESGRRHAHGDGGTSAAAADSAPGAALAGGSREIAPVGSVVFPDGPACSASGSLPHRAASGRGGGAVPEAGSGASHATPRPEMATRPPSLAESPSSVRGAESSFAGSVSSPTRSPAHGKVQSGVASASSSQPESPPSRQAPFSASRAAAPTAASGADSSSQHAAHADKPEAAAAIGGSGGIGSQGHSHSGGIGSKRLSSGSSWVQEMGGGIGSKRLPPHLEQHFGWSGGQGRGGSSRTTPSGSGRGSAAARTVAQQHQHHHPAAAHDLRRREQSTAPATPSPLSPLRK